jgi:hypothetical protein
LQVGTQKRDGIISLHDGPHALGDLELSEFSVFGDLPETVVLKATRGIALMGLSRGREHLELLGGDVDSSEATCSVVVGVLKNIHVLTAIEDGVGSMSVEG